MVIFQADMAWNRRLLSFRRNDQVIQVIQVVQSTDQTVPASVLRLLSQSKSVVPCHIGYQNHHNSFSVGLSTACNYSHVLHRNNTGILWIPLSNMLMG